MFILETEEAPDPSSKKFAQASQKADECRMLNVALKDDIEDPVEADDWVDNHGSIIH